MGIEDLNPTNLMTMSDEEFNSTENDIEAVSKDLTNSTAVELDENNEYNQNAENDTNHQDSVDGDNSDGSLPNENDQNSEDGYEEENSNRSESDNKENIDDEDSEFNLFDSIDNEDQDSSNTSDTDDKTNSQVNDQESDTSTKKLDAQSLYDSLINTDIKANGGNLKIESVEDAVKFVQLGANYTKKMQQLAPHRAVLHALEVNNMTDPSVVNHLIDIHNHDKQAIAALVKKAGLTAEDLFEDEYDSLFDDEDDDSENGSNNQNADEYKAKDHVQDTDTLILNETVTDIITEYGQETLTSIDRYIDQGSYELLKSNPEDLKALAEQSKSGVMDLINNKIEELTRNSVFTKDIPYLTKYRIAGELLIKDSQHPVDRKVGGVKSSHNAYRSNSTNPIRHAESRTVSAPKKLSINDPSSIMTMSEESFAEFEASTRNLKL